MQNPPPGPPPSTPPPGPPPGNPPPGGYQQGTPPPYQQGGYQQPAASSGIDKRTGAFLAYLLGWITGLIMLFVGKNDPDVKYHAAQSLVFFGGLQVLSIILSIVGGIVHLFGFISIVGYLVGLFAFIMWIV